MLDSQGFSFVSQQIRNLVVSGFLGVPEQNLNQEQGFFSNKSLENRIQPASFEPTLADELFILDTEGYGLLRPRREESIYRTLLQIPKRKRPRKDISDGFELKTGFTYLVKLNERFSPDSGKERVTSIRSSPKSSTGRVFPKTRFLADYNPAFDEIYVFNKNGMDMWLLIQPIPFNLIVSPGLSLNQLRFFSGDARLNDEELREEFRNNALLYEKTTEGKVVVVDSTEGVISDGIKLNLDASGNKTQGVFGLRARRNPDPIDLSKIGSYLAEDYFEPIMVGGKNSLRRGENYLLSSNEVLSVPAHLSSELRRHSREGIEGRTHDAGFVDPGFKGDVVLEVTPDEETEVSIQHRMPLSSLDFFRTSEPPDKVYGEDIRSNYQGQIGARISKHFRPFDFETASRNHERLSRIVLVEDAHMLKGFRGVQEGFEPVSESNAGRLIERLQGGFFHSRYDCEEDTLVLQPIPYTIIFNTKGEVFSYVRTEDKQEYGDVRLLGKHSVGLGGHVTGEDAPAYIERCLEREVTVEEVKFSGERSKPVLVGTLYASDKPVDRVHFGLIYAMHTNGDVTPNEKSIAVAEFVPLDEIGVNHRGAETETWSKILLPYLEFIRATSKKYL